MVQLPSLAEELLMSEQIVIESLVNRPRQLVWACYNQPEHIVKWNFASDDWRCPSAEVDLCVGGRLHTRMEAKDGSFGFDFEAIYDEVLDGVLVAYTLSDGRQVQTTFEDRGAGTQVTTRFAAESENPVDMQRAGWQAILDNFARYVEST